MKRTTAIALLSLSLARTGCTVGPRYKRPDVDVPVAHRGIDEENAGKTDTVSLADQELWELFQDPQQQQLLTNAAQDAARLSDIRYRGGATSYLEALTSQTNVLSAEINLAEAQLNELNSFVQLYRSLGGGWQQ
jgi:outer membrane protein TolC